MKNAHGGWLTPEEIKNPIRDCSRQNAERCPAYERFYEAVEHHSSQGSSGDNIVRALQKGRTQHATLGWLCSQPELVAHKGHFPLSFKPSFTPSHVSLSQS